MKFLTPPYFRYMCYFHKVGIHCVIIKCTFIKKIMGLTPILNSFWPNLLVSIFWNFQKKIFSAPFWHFSQNYWFYLYFRIKQPCRIKINVTWTILSLQTLEMAHFDPQYQKVKMRPYKRHVKKEKWSSYHSELEKWKFVSSKLAHFWPFFVVFLIFWGLPLSFGTSVIHA